jgi:hypothetical protein
VLLIKTSAFCWNNNCVIINMHGKLTLKKKKTIILSTQLSEARNIPEKSANIQFPICFLVCPLQTRIKLHNAAILSAVCMAETRGMVLRTVSENSLLKRIIVPIREVETRAENCTNRSYVYESRTRELQMCGVTVHENIPATTKLWVKMGWANSTSEGRRVQGDCSLLDTEIQYSTNLRGEHQS